MKQVTIETINGPLAGFRQTLYITAGDETSEQQAIADAICPDTDRTAAEILDNYKIVTP